MVPSRKPGQSEPYGLVAAAATRAALADAGIGYDEVQAAYAGYVYGDSCSGQAALYHAKESRALGPGLRQIVRVGAAAQGVLRPLGGGIGQGHVGAGAAVGGPRMLLVRVQNEA